jgi:uncharacterized membrane protein
MSWIILLLGVGLWAGAHLFKRVRPDLRAPLGDRGKGIVAVALVASIVIMVIGYRGTGFVQVWSPPSFLVHVNNLLILIAIYLMSPAPRKGRLLNGLRHPMLGGFKLWAFAHLLVNGDLASILLFGGLLAWAVSEVIVINKSEPEWTPGAPGTLAKDGMFFAGSIVLLIVIGYIHAWLGVWPFGG